MFPSQALAAEPDALIEEAETLSRQGDAATACTQYGRALARLGERPDPAREIRALAGLGWALQGLGELAEARSRHEAALTLLRREFPDARAALCTIHQGIGACEAALGHPTAALAAYREVLAVQRSLPCVGPAELVATLNLLGETAAQLELYEEARRWQKEALAILRAHHPADHPEIAAAITNLGVSLFRLGEVAEAEARLREALRIDPELLLAAENLVHILYKQERKAEGRALAVATYRRRSFVVQPAPRHSEGTLLALWALDGNIPRRHLLARLKMQVIDWHIQYASAAHEQALPPYDLVFNLIGDADHGAAALDCAAAFRARSAAPWLNDPRTVARTRRDLIPDLLGGIEGLVIPRVLRLSAAAFRAPGRDRLLAEAGISPPFLLRSAGMHGGESVRRILSDKECEDAAAALGEDETIYLTSYHDYASPDRFYRKYRILFVDRVPFPYHLAISSHWLVHYFSADMAVYPSKIEEELRYLEDPASVLGPLAMAALADIGRRLDFDYCGADFSLLPDGRVLLFEANATMLVHPEEEAGVLAAKNPHIARILAAFDALVTRTREAAGQKPPPS